MVEPLTIAVTATGVLVVKRAIEAIGEAAAAAEKPVLSLGTVIAALSAGGAVYQLGQLLNTFQQLENGLRTVTGTTLEVKYAQEQLFEVAQRSRGSWEESERVFIRVKRALEGMGPSMNEVIRITELLNKALAVGGATGQERFSVLIQFTQALSSGKLGGDELRSIIENSTVLSEVIAKQMGVTRGQLRELGKEGKITSEVLIKAFRNYGDYIEDLFKKTTPTVDQAFTTMKNASAKHLVELDKQLGLTTSLSKALMFMAENMDTITKLTAPLALGILAVAAATGGFGATLSIVFNLLLFNPVSAFLIAIAGAALLLYNFSDKIGITSDGITNLWHLMRVMYDGLLGWIQRMKDAASALGDFLSGGNGISADEAMKETARALDNILQTSAGSIEALKEVWKIAKEQIPETWTDMFKNMYDSSVDWLAKMYDYTLGALAKVVSAYVVARDKAKDNIDPDAQAVYDKVVKEMAEVGQRVGEAFKRGVTSVGNPVSDWLNQNIEAAQRLARLEYDNWDPKKMGSFTPAGFGGGYNNPIKPPPPDTKGLKKSQSDLDSLLKKYDQVDWAQRELVKTEATLTAAAQKGLISWEKKARIMEQVRNALRDNLDPLGELNRKLDEEAKANFASNETREATLKLLAEENKLREKGITLGAQEKAGLMQKIQGIEAIKNSMATVRSAFERVFSGMEDALVQFVQTGKVEFKDLVNAMIADLIRLAFQASVTKPFSALLTDYVGKLGAQLGGAGQVYGPQVPPGWTPPAPTPLADGGPFSANQPLLVGEKRPELVMFNRPGPVIPHVPQGGGGDNVQVIINAPEGSKVKKHEKRKQGNMDIREFTISTVNEAAIAGKLPGISARYDAPERRTLR